MLMKSLLVVLLIFFGCPSFGQLKDANSYTVINDIQYYSGADYDTANHKLNLVIPNGVEQPPLFVWIWGGAWSRRLRRVFCLRDSDGTTYYTSIKFCTIWRPLSQTYRLDSRNTHRRKALHKLAVSAKPEILRRSARIDPDKYKATSPQSLLVSGTLTEPLSPDSRNGRLSAEAQWWPS